MANNNAKFLSVIGAESRVDILGSIAKHYGISAEQAFAEVTSEESEHLLDYLVEPIRGAVSVLMQCHGLRGF